MGTSFSEKTYNLQLKSGRKALWAKKVQMY
jgi:hypothetical protein